MPRKSLVETYREKYMKALRAGSEAKASTAITSAIRNNVNPLDIYMKILLDCERELGELWMSGEIDIAQEHLATEITLEQMNRMRPLLRPTSRHGHRVVATSIEGDMHYVALKVASDFLYFDGWEVDFLGPNTPSKDIVSFLRDKKTDLLLMSVTLPEHLGRLPSLVGMVRELGDRSPKIIAGGGAFKSQEQAIEDYELDGYAATPLEVMPLAKSVCELQDDRPDLETVLNNLGEQIRVRRKELGFSQQELAKLAGLDRAYISGLENGKQNVSLGAVIKIAKALEIGFEKLLSLNGLAQVGDASNEADIKYSFN